MGMAVSSVNMTPFSASGFPPVPITPGTMLTNFDAGTLCAMRFTCVDFQKKAPAHLRASAMFPFERKMLLPGGYKRSAATKTGVVTASKKSIGVTTAGLTCTRPVSIQRIT